MAALGRTPSAPATVPPVARRPLLAVAGAVAAVLVLTSARYGYHRDELYFLVAGRNPDWGYPDQPPLTPILARLMDTIGPGSLVVLRLPSALATGVVVLLTGLIARELGGAARAQLIAAGCSAVSAFALITGHLLSTTTLDVLFSTLLVYLAVRAVRTRQHFLLAWAGLVLGLGLLNKLQVGVLAAALLVGLAAVGPRRLLRTPWLGIGALIAAVCLAPYLAWQALNGWPQLDMAREIAGEGEQGGRLGFLPFQLLLVGPLLVPVWVAGLVWLLRRPAGRPYRFLAIAYLVLAAFYLVTGGKAYYLAAIYPALLAAGGIAVSGWLDGAKVRGRLLVGAVAVSAVTAAVLGLALLPVRALGPVVAVNYDAGEQVGWPAYVDQVATVWNALPGSQRASGLVLTENYGEAGAIDRYGPDRGLPPAYSGHNGFADWRVPTGQAGPVVLVGYADAELRTRLFGSCQQQATLDDGVGLDNDEQGRPVWLCGAPPRPWVEVWPEVTHLG